MAQRWFVFRGDKKQGPFTSAQLQQLAADGRLKPSDWIQKEGNENPVAASAVKGLFPEQGEPQERFTSSPESAKRPPSATDDGWKGLDAVMNEEPAGESHDIDGQVGKPKRKEKKPSVLTLVALGVTASLLLFCCGGSCIWASRYGDKLSEAELKDPKSKKNAQRKLEAFRAIVSHFNKMPGPLDGQLAAKKWDDEAEKLMRDFDAIPFDPVANRSVAKEMVEIYDKRIQGKFSGNRANILSNEVQNIAEKLVASP